MLSLKFSGLRARLLVLVLLGVVPAFVLLTYSGVQHRRLLSAEMRRDARRLATMASFQQETLIAENRRLLAGLAAAPELRVGGSAQACQRFLASLLARHPNAANLVVFRPNGDRYCSAVTASRPGNAADRDYFRRAVANKGFAVGSYQIGRITGKPVLVFAYAVLDASGALQSVLAVAEDLAWLDRILAAGRLPEHSVLTVVDRGGTVLARYPDGGPWVGKPVLKGRAALSQVVAHGGEASIDVASPDGVRRIFSFVPLSTTYHPDLYVGIGIPESAARAAEERALAGNLLLMGLAALFVFALAWFGGDVLVLRRLEALAQAARRLAGGDLAARAGLREDAGELGQLGRAFDHMAESLQSRIRDLRRIERALKTLSAGNHAMLHAQEESSLLRDACRIVVEQGGHRVAWVGYAEHDEEKTIRILASAGAGSEVLKDVRVTWSENELGQGPSGTAIRTGKPSVSRNIHSDPRLAPWRTRALEGGFVSTLALPLKTNGEMIGNLTIYSADPDAFGEQEVELLGELADDLGFGIGMLRLRAENKRGVAALEHAAYHDALTDLPNRARLSRHLEGAIGDAEKHGRSVALLDVDINRFREINEALGYREGDALLQLVGARLRELAADPDTVARLGGDEFAVVLNSADAGAAIRFSREVLAALARPFNLSDFSLELQASVGIALYPGHAEGASALLRQANAAVHRAKKAGTEYAFPAQDGEQGTVRRLALTRDLRRAMETDQLVLYCQPKIDIASGAVCGAEMLARWNHPELGAISPGEFIALAERTGLIKPLTYWVTNETARNLHEIQKKGQGLPLAINISVRNLRDPELIERIRGICATWGIPPARLQLELTESALMEDHEAARAVLIRLHDMGFALHIDDFGTGYSSLAYLQRLPVDAIKIDQSFVRKMLTDEGSRTIARSTIDLAHNLGLKAIAEGVEDQQTLDLLAQMGCDMAQGFHIARPMAMNELYEWLVRRSHGL